MRNLLKVLLPPLTGFIAVIGFTVLSDILISSEFQGNEFGWGIFYFASFFMVIALILQVIIVILWNITIQDFKRRRVKAILILTSFCLIGGIGISYMIWESKFGMRDLLISIGFIMFIQLVYWTANIFTLYKLDKLHIVYEV
jgi:hypothetical protein